MPHEPSTVEYYAAFLVTCCTICVRLIKIENLLISNIMPP